MFKNFQPKRLFCSSFVDSISINSKLYNKKWLRDHCSCPLCIHPIHKQKLHASADIVSKSEIARFQIESNCLDVVWKDGHNSRFRLDWLARNSEQPKQKVKNENILWNLPLLINKGFPSITYSRYNSVEGFKEALDCIYKLGIVHLTGVAIDNEEITKVARKIGVIRSTFYGDTWDVVHSESSKNIAYTNVQLGLHMDLLYFENPPGIQILHCLKNTVEGGESILADSFYAADVMKKRHPEYFKVLKSVKIQYKYENDGRHFEFARPIFSEVDGEISVFYSPYFQGIIEIEQGEAESFYSALATFSSIVNSPENVWKFKLKPGDLIIFNNRRVLHAREAFKTQGARHLKGCYVEYDDFLSTRRMSSALK